MRKVIDKAAIYIEFAIYEVVLRGIKLLAGKKSKFWTNK